MTSHHQPIWQLDAKRAAAALILTTLALAGFVRAGDAGASAAAKTSKQAPASLRCFAETGYCVGPLFSTYWQEHGGLAINGYPISDERAEVLEDGKAYTVQYFERVRMEYHPEKPSQDHVLLSQFGRSVHGGADPPVAPPSGPLTTDRVYVADTGHFIVGVFFNFWLVNGGGAQFGHPLTEEFEEVLEDGKTYRVQYFERARLEYHPENTPPYDVLLGQFGRRILTEMPPRSIAPCLAGNLAVRTAADAGAGQRYATIALTNTANAICTLAGTPQVELRSASDVPLDVATQATGDVPIGIVVMAPGSTAHFGLHWNNWCGPDPSQVSIHVTLPNNGGQFTTTGIDTPPCLGEGQVSKLEIKPFAGE